MFVTHENYRLHERLEYFLSNVAIIWLALVFYATNKYYLSFLRPETKISLILLAVAYVIFGTIFYVVVPIERLKRSKGAVVIRTLGRMVSDLIAYLRRFTDEPQAELPRISHEEKTALLFALVKVFFIPIMLNFFFADLEVVRYYFPLWAHGHFVLNEAIFTTTAFPFLLNLLFCVDTSFFIFGYCIEAGVLHNRVRSVEPTAFGWGVALICYPPFNGFFGTYFSGYTNDYVSLSSARATALVRIFILLFYLIYVSATVALGAKGSNLTNRGIVSSGPYALVRHPAYISKNIAWWIGIIPLLAIRRPFESLAIIGSMALSSFVYFLRAITEERHLIRDPEYVDYCKRVRYRFIPYVY